MARAAGSRRRGTDPKHFVLLWAFAPIPARRSRDHRACWKTIGQSAGRGAHGLGRPCPAHKHGRQHFKNNRIYPSAQRRSPIPQRNWRACATARPSTRKPPRCRLRRLHPRLDHGAAHGAQERHHRSRRHRRAGEAEKDSQNELTIMNQWYAEQISAPTTTTCSFPSPRLWGWTSLPSATPGSARGR